jgi:hypothetical protein
LGCGLGQRERGTAAGSDIRGQVALSFTRIPD